MTIQSFGNTAIVLEHIVAVEMDEQFSGGEAVRVYLAGMLRPLELFVPEPEKTYLAICAAVAKTRGGQIASSDAAPAPRSFDRPEP